jgi:hemoglobin-like flavoprotein
MTPDQIQLVQSSFAKVAPASESVAALFYSTLFRLDPSLRSLFKGDLQEQGRKLMAMLSIAVAGLDRLPTLVPAVEALGERHVAYGVEDSHYDTVGAALLETLEKGLGPDFTPAARTAWTTTYTTLAEVMKAAAQMAK